jgi:Tfp pilus assembly protein PilE
MRKGFWKGLRTVEIIIIGSLICMLLLVFYFRYDRFACRSMQSEAKFFLAQIYHAQMRFHEESQTYAPLKELLADGRVVVHQSFFDFEDFIAPTNHQFMVKAIGRPGTLVAGEEWTINQGNLLDQRVKKCQ